jgi:hypothetical protein
MAVDEITSVNPIPPAAQQIAGNAGIRTSARLRGTNQAQAIAVPQQPNPIPQNELLSNPALQNLSFVPQPQADTLLTNETPVQLAVNQTLQNISANQQDALGANQAGLNLNATAQATTPATAAAATSAGTTAASPQAAAAAPQQTVAAAPAGTTAAPVVPSAPGEVTTQVTPQVAITSTNAVPSLPAEQQIPGGNPGAATAPAPLTGANQAPGAAAVTQEPNPILQNELPTNQTPQNLSFVPQPQTNTQINATPAQPAANEPLLNLNAAAPTTTPAAAAAVSAGATAAAPQQAAAAVAAAAVPAQVQEPDPVLQNELLINQALQNLNFVQGGLANTPLINITPPLLANPETTEGNIILQNELLINQALQNLNFVSQPQTNPLLINETPAQLAANETLQNLTPVEQNQLQTNQALLNLNATAQTTTPAAVTQATAATTATAVQQVAPTQQTAAAPALATTQLPATTVTAAAATVPPIVPLASGAVTTVFTPTPVAANFVESFRVPYFLQNPDRTPYVLAVYEVGNPNPAPAEPAPIPNEVRPPLPADRTRQVGRATLRQSWSNYQSRAYSENIPPATPVGERNLRHVLTQVNADMAANGLPLHLVFARNEAGYALNVYDCSDTELCRLTRDIPLKFEDTTITNLLQETGIMINTTS